MHKCAKAQKVQPRKRKTQLKEFKQLEGKNPGNKRGGANQGEVIVDQSDIAFILVTPVFFP